MVVASSEGWEGRQPTIILLDRGIEKQVWTSKLAQSHKSVGREGIELLLGPAIFAMGVRLDVSQCKEEVSFDV